MAYQFKAEGAFAYVLGEETVEGFRASPIIATNTDGRAPDTGAAMTVKGKIRSIAETGLADSTIYMAQWANNQDDSKAYQVATATATAAGQILREDVYPQSFVVSYAESFDVSSGVGSFELELRQKKDLVEGVTVRGGYTA